jgi:hypothetical protein
MRLVAFVDLAAGKGPADMAALAQVESRAVWDLHKEGALRSIQMRQSMKANHRREDQLGMSRCDRIV